MDQSVLDEIKQSLEDEKTKLEKALGDFTSKDSTIKDNYRSEFPDFGNDEDENANEVAEYSDRLSLEHTLEKQLRDVHQALASIVQGKYGVCKHCGKAIEIERLKIRPTSSSCVNCKKQLKGEA
ncbi:MAG: TraR/DksA C4-type zinc finger protein [Patescibacteria group bacterium]|jgi:RNA polymerase-binding protein DksA|nr:TraR/DksA C4-type zinc finger protein [Patescibacteria group bacterium]